VRHPFWRLWEVTRQQQCLALDAPPESLHAVFMWHGRGAQLTFITTCDAKIEPVPVTVSPVKPLLVRPMASGLPALRRGNPSTC